MSRSPFQLRVTAFGCAGLGAAMLVIGSAVAQPAQTRGLELFSVMMPVFTDDRCMNCHGVVNPATGTEHGGGIVKGDSCATCHTEGATPEMQQNPMTGQSEPTGEMVTQWQLPPPEMSFVGKSAAALCHQVKAMTSGGTDSPAVVMAHFEADARIQMAFEGLRGFDDKSKEWPVDPEPPSMSEADFLAAAARWTTEGGMSCGAGWFGTITRRHTYRFEQSETLGGGVNDRGGPHTVQENEDDFTTIDIEDGVGTATRTITYTSTESFHKIVGGQCKPGAQLTWGTYDLVQKEVRQGTATAEVDLSITLQPAGTYQVVYGMPLPGQTDTITEHLTTHVCGPDAKYAGLLPGSGPDIDRQTTKTATVTRTGTGLATEGLSGTIDASSPDRLSGHEQVPTGDTYMLETFWTLSRN